MRSEAVRQGGELFIFVHRADAGAVRAIRVSGLAEPGRRVLVVAAAGTGAGKADTLADALAEELAQSESAPGLPVRVEPWDDGDWTSLADVELSLLVALSSGDAWVEEPWQEPWLKTADERVLPVLPLSLQPSTAKLFAGKLQSINAAFWRDEVSELIPAILARLGYTAEVPRIFISYRRNEAQALANQLFDALTRRNFEVFLDHVSVPPGLYFQRRLAQQLGDKTVVLVIESAGLLNSEWTRYEIATAQLNGLALIGLQVPGGVRIPSIDESRRINLKRTDFVDGQWSAEAELLEERLEDVVLRIVAEHDRGLRWRFALVRRSIEAALAAEGLSFRPAGRATLCIEKDDGRKYRVWICSRAPEFDDFHAVGLQCAAVDPADGGAVVGTTALLEPVRQQRFVWLSDLSKLRLYDLREVGRAASEIKGEEF
jgi:hypothetical protein